jgi:ABC-2 type transport system ATP-binding protein
VRFASPPAGADIVGTPTVRLSYRGTADPARTFVYASVVDANADRVIGGESTPIPVVLDGRAHSVERPLEAIAVHSVAGSAYRLQISSGGATYALQSSVGNIAMTTVRGTLPRVDATRAGIAATRRRRTPMAPSVSVQARGGRSSARVAVSARLRSTPCAGTVTFAIRIGRRLLHRTAKAAARTCVARATVRAKAAPGTPVRVSASFGGNAELAPRRAQTVAVVVQAA